MGEELVVAYDHTQKVIGALHVVGTEQVQKAATAIAQYASANHPYQNRTGEAESAFYVVMQGSSTYGQGVVGGGDLLPSVDAPADDQTALVANASPHFLFLELGTVKMSAYPSLIPAVEAVRAAFASGDGWEAALAKLVGT